MHADLKNPLLSGIEFKMKCINYLIPFNTKIVMYFSDINSFKFFDFEIKKIVYFSEIL